MFTNPTLGSSVVTCRLAFSKISLSINEKRLERSPGKGRTYNNLADGVTALAQQWQRTLYPNFIVIKFDSYVI